jgi:isochorismate synthase
VVDAGTQAGALAAALAALREQATAGLRRNGHAHLPARPVVFQRELRPVADWKADVVEAARAVRAGSLEKVVLARAVELHATTSFDAVQALRHLAESYADCYLFAIAHQDRCFLGATPERLIQLHDGELLTMSLAGSIRRGRTPEDDAQLGRALLGSAKDRNEHAVVVKAIVETLSALCTTLRVSDPPRLLKLGNIQHICTTLTGTLAGGRTVFDLVERLHPTPAMGGRPRDVALQLIRECEKMDRGWYAGPVGWVDSAGEGDFAAAIRSALLHRNTATLFAGCGIVADSDPEREYAESILKLKPMLAALGAASDS